MRVNFTLNEDNNKDKVIIDFLESKYNTTYYIKNLLYDMALGNSTPITQTNEKPKEDFEEIAGLDDIDL